jgi:hypothetical protein
VERRGIDLGGGRKMRTSLALLALVVLAGQPIAAAPPEVIPAESPIADELICPPVHPLEGDCSKTGSVTRDDAFIMSVQHGRLKGQFEVFLTEFDYNEEACRWEYELAEPVEIIDGSLFPWPGSEGSPRRGERAVTTRWLGVGLAESEPLEVTLATLYTLTVQFRVAEPYAVYYSYNIGIAGLGAVDASGIETPTATVTVCVAPIEIPPGEYQGRTYEAEGFWEESGNGWVQKNAIGMDMEDPPGQEAIVDHMVLTTAGQGETFQRGFAWMSCDSPGCGGSVDFSYPMPPDYVYIPFGEIERFWIEHSWQGSVGDEFSSVGRFTVEQQQ